ncbi:hypothetical protein PGT21_021760 [Puccinia graminis f. sp. tritici]|uniref:C2H2-type domain-containing protein n=1 Tax=Puccinia graminis f. sp. tritici TaxID=56615 RepID=A0A5B0M796_PUCGR|nr:hypothetical protein PGTUg99_008746 [Puccinia graminis f. sp. tritici]KAA1071870.1 hypothetical protein PGT21_021760 [Puccinia graminis f. sp. tritici]
MHIWKGLIFCFAFEIGMSFAIGHAESCRDKTKVIMRTPEGHFQYTCPAPECTSKYFAVIEHFCTSCQNLIEVELVKGCHEHEETL